MVPSDAVIFFGVYCWLKDAYSFPWSTYYSFTRFVSKMSGPPILRSLGFLGGFCLLFKTTASSSSWLVMLDLLCILPSMQVCIFSSSIDFVTTSLLFTLSLNDKNVFSGSSGAIFSLAVIVIYTAGFPAKELAGAANEPVFWMVTPGKTWWMEPLRSLNFSALGSCKPSDLLKSAVAMDSLC